MKFWRFKNFIYFSVLSLLTLLPSYPQKIEMKDGVRVTHNEIGGKWGEDFGTSLRLIGTLGGIDVEDENLAFNLPYDIVMDKGGNLYILDTGNLRIQKFSFEGKYLAT